MWPENKKLAGFLTMSIESEAKIITIEFKGLNIYQHDYKMKYEFILI